MRLVYLRSLLAESPWLGVEGWECVICLSSACPNSLCAGMKPATAEAMACATFSCTSALPYCQSLP